MQVRRPSTITELVALGLSRGCLSPNPLDRGKTSPWDLAKSYPLSSPEPPSEYSSELAQSQSAVSSSPLGEVEYLESPPDSPSPQNPIYTWKTTPCEILSSTAPTITGYSPDGNLSNYVSYISEISFHTNLSEDHAVIHGHGPLLRL
ncbi:hypothetical protein Acr_20g0008600 [Actinidia rufa]|uniref:Uncharacterized protein n=1 Tax=Actinidia rufa TaxID=165716 RepID=A0A7J0GEA1_9ERIC|nr:hypothetical protein Acr_20g0008600 [Actinidia rufa]